MCRMKILIFAFLGAAIIRIWFAAGTPRLGEVLGQLGAMAAGFVLIAAVWYVTRALWRAARNVRVDDVAHRAGAITDAAQRRASQAAQAFKDGRGR